MPRMPGKALLHNPPWSPTHHEKYVRHHTNILPAIIPDAFGSVTVIYMIYGGPPSLENHDDINA